MTRVKALGVSAGLVALVAAVALPAWASEGQAITAGGLPPAGATRHVAEQVSNAVVKCGGHEYTVDLSGGADLQVGTAIEPFSGPLIVPITTVHDHLTGDSVDFGHIEMSDTAAETGELIESSDTEVFPAKESLPIDPVFTVQHDPCDPSVHMLEGVSGDPGPAILRNPNVTTFPPQNDVYQLVGPIDLEDVNNPGPVLATIQNFPLTVNPPIP
jgi:hypothetical protein